MTTLAWAGAKKLPKRVLILGSGALQIGQAGEFDYSGSQALKALKEDGIHSVLLNPNIATIQTSEELAGAVYFLPVSPHFAARVIEKENIDGILLSFGGQTALNCGLELADTGVLARFGVRVLGSTVETIRACEDRELFNRKLAEIGVHSARSIAVTSVAAARKAADEIGYPVILRAAFSLGGKGSAIARSRAEFEAAAERAFSGVPQVLVEESLSGWKEIEYEVVRDIAGNAITVCNMENVDPMGIHTGESIVVAPSQTLNDAEYQMLRDVAIRTITHLGIVGECNIQYALDPRTGDYRVIEVNPRLSRSSALASKATGYPLAYIGAKLALGYTLPELPNSITKTTTAFFEPALDYVVCKIPRWDFDKFGGVDSRIGTEMKSVGEVMAIGRSFPEVLQKALRMQDDAVVGLDPDAYAFDDLRRALAEPSPRRIFAVARAFAEGIPIAEIAALTAIDRYFLSEIEGIVQLRARLNEKSGADQLDAELLMTAKRAGFSDRGIAALTQTSWREVEARRHLFNIRPRLTRIDTLAAEYPAETNYLYFTYGADASEVIPTQRRRILVLGSGCYRIGSSVEFDWCCVNSVQTAREMGFETILINCNPETVSTDHDLTDQLVLDEISLENIKELWAQQSIMGVVVSMGGQASNNLAVQLAEAGIRLLGTPAESIDRAEDRRRFSMLCDQLGIDQPRWHEATALEDLDRAVDVLGGYPVLVRPSYVLSGSAMRVAHGAAELRNFVGRATSVSPDHPVVVTKFESHAREFEFDGVASRGKILLWAVSEHIEDAGVHSGDATLVLPPQRLYLETLRRARRIVERLAAALDISGPFNVQMLARNNELKVIECNLRASRSFPFISKALGVNFIREATRIILGAAPDTDLRPHHPFEMEHVAVKAPMFSFRRLSGADPILGVEMASTGEVGCFGADSEEALLKAMLATGFRLPRKAALLSLGPVGDKYRFIEEVQMLARLGLRIFATPGTARILQDSGYTCEPLEKDAVGSTHRAAVEAMRSGEIDLVINVPREHDEEGRPDGFIIRRAAIDLEIPLITDLWLARKVVRALNRYGLEDLAVKAWSEYIRPQSAGLPIGASGVWRRPY